MPIHPLTTKLQKRNENSVSATNFVSRKLTVWTNKEGKRYNYDRQDADNNPKLRIYPTEEYESTAA